MEKPLIYVLDDEPNMGKILEKVLVKEGYDVTAFQDPLNALSAIREQSPNLLLSDLRMPGLTGDELLKTLRSEGIPSQVIIMTAYGTIENALECVRSGAFDYVTKPFVTKDLLKTIERALEKADQAFNGKSFEPPEAATEPLIGECDAIKNVKSLIKKIAPTDASVLILGESGTGKEVVARAIHDSSPRAEGRFLAINCASIPESLMESELFGHEKGAFTGAAETRVGLMEAAEGGTLFLDEIGEMPPILQAKLLRSLQEREITRVGAVDSIPIDIRVLAATNRNLTESVRNGSFREDLYYRLNVFTVKLPALKDRGNDVLLIAEAFLKQQQRVLNNPNLNFSEALKAEILTMPWPGNVRELQNFIQRLAVLTDKDEMDAELLNILPHTSSHSPVNAVMTEKEITDFREARGQFEEQYLRSLLKACSGNVTEAAKKSGMSRRNLYEKLERFSLKPDEFKG